VEVRAVNCFVHRDRPAVGLCLDCNRGVCAECAAEVDDALACRGRCEGRVKRLVEVRNWSTRQPLFQVRYLAHGRMTMSVLGALLFIIGLPAGALAYDDGNRALAFLCLSASGIGLLFAILYARSSPAERLRACLRCGYDLKGNTSGRCPECGTPC
jgi:hypothetical protein